MDLFYVIVDAHKVVCIKGADVNHFIATHIVLHFIATHIVLGQLKIHKYVEVLMY